MKPIIFNTEMVKVILDGRKTQFRKHIGNYVAEDGKYEGFRNEDVELVNGRIEIHTTLARKIKSKYKVGDILYVKETFQTCECGFCEICQVLDGIVFKADYNNKGEHPDLYSCHEDETYWKSSIHLKLEDARLFLKVTNVRVERLQDMDIEDFLDEGVIDSGFNVYYTDNGMNEYHIYLKNQMETIWNSTAKDGYKWEDNPYVFVYEFERVELREVK